MSHLLIYDADLSGHHRDYLDAVVNYVEHHSPLANGVVRITFMLPVQYWSGRKDADKFSHISRLDIPLLKLEHRNKLTPRKRAVYELGMLADVVASHKVDEVILMNLDYFQVALATSHGQKLSCPVSGIQLQPYTRTELVALQSPRKPGLLFRAWRKRFRLMNMLKSNRISRLLIPADEAAVDLLNKRHAHLVNAVVLPEPYLTAARQQNADEMQVLPDIRSRYALQERERIVLVFGKLAARKNIGKVIEAVMCLRRQGHESIVLLVVGKASARYQKKLQALVGNDYANNSAVRFDFDFVDDNVLRAVFTSCDVVAMPYSKAYQSSGILFQAIQYGKPVITANKGLADDLVRDYKLGETVDPRSVNQISTAILSLIDAWKPSPTIQSLMDFHTADNHAAVLLKQK